MWMRIVLRIERGRACREYPSFQAYYDYYDYDYDYNYNSSSCRCYWPGLLFRLCVYETMGRMSPSINRGQGLVNAGTLTMGRGPILLAQRPRTLFFGPLELFVYLCGVMLVRWGKGGRREGESFEAVRKLSSSHFPGVRSK